MFNSPVNNITDMERVFLEPYNATHRQYEALRAYFIDRLPSAEAAARFGYSPGSFGRILSASSSYLPRRDLAAPPRRKI